MPGIYQQIEHDIAVFCTDQNVYQETERLGTVQLAEELVPSQ